MKTASFDDMFIVVEYVLRSVGLSELHLRQSTNSILFNASQKLIYIFGATQEPLLMLGELIFIIMSLSAENLTTEIYLNIAEVTPCLILCIFAMAKSLRLIVKRHAMIKMFEELKSMWPEPNEMDDETRKIVERSMRLTNSYCTVYSVGTIVLSMVYNFFPIIIMAYNTIKKGETNYLMPYLIWYPYDYSKSFWVWMSSFISQFYAGVFTTSTVVCADCYFAFMATQISMHLQLLCRDLNRVPIDDGSKLTLRKKLSNVVILHNKLISLCKVVEDIFSPIILMNLLGSSLMICILLFSITIAPMHLMIKYLMFISSAMTQIFMLSLYGNAIVEKSLMVSNAAYSSPWMDLTGPDAIHYKKSLIMIAIRSQRHLKISAFGFANISMNTFASILKAAMSYFTLLRAVYQKNNKL